MKKFFEESVLKFWPNYVFDWKHFQKVIAIIKIRAKSFDDFAEYNYLYKWIKNLKKDLKEKGSCKDDWNVIRTNQLVHIIE